MMKYMEIATYLGFVLETLKNSRNGLDTEALEMVDKLSEATCEAQLIMYELARKQLRDEIAETLQGE